MRDHIPLTLKRSDSTDHPSPVLGNPITSLPPEADNYCVPNAGVGPKVEDLGSVPGTELLSPVASFAQGVLREVGKGLELRIRSQPEVRHGIADKRAVI